MAAAAVLGLGLGSSSCCSSRSRAGTLGRRGLAYGVREVGWLGGGDGDGDGGQVHLLALEVANMDAVLNGESFQVPMTVAIQHVDEDTTVATT